MKFRIAVLLPDNEKTDDLLARAVLLLEEVAHYGAILPAARTLGLSYSCAWSSIRKVEEALGEELLFRTGGSTGCKLTPAGLALIREYRRVLQAAQSAAEAAETSP